MVDIGNFDGLTINKNINASLKNMFRVTISADENDADYKYEILDISENEIMEYVPALALIAKGRINGWYGLEMDSRYKSEEVSDELSEFLFELIPSAEHGVHSVSLDEIIYFDSVGSAHNVTVN